MSTRMQDIMKYLLPVAAGATAAYSPIAGRAVEGATGAIMAADESKRRDDQQAQEMALRYNEATDNMRLRDLQAQELQGHLDTDKKKAAAAQGYAADLTGRLSDYTQTAQQDAPFSGNGPLASSIGEKARYAQGMIPILEQARRLSEAGDIAPAVSLLSSRENRDYEREYQDERLTKEQGFTSSENAKNRTNSREMQERGLHKRELVQEGHPDGSTTGKFVDPMAGESIDMGVKRSPYKAERNTAFGTIDVNGPRGLVKGGFDSEDAAQAYIDQLEGGSVSKPKIQDGTVYENPKTGVKIVKQGNTWIDPTTGKPYAAPKPTPTPKR